MVFTPDYVAPDAPPAFEDMCGEVWTQICRHECAFSPDIFFDKMMNLIKNPNINSSWLFRADIVYDDASSPARIGEVEDESRPRVREVKNIPRTRILIRTLVPRNTLRDAPVNQTCTFHQHSSQGEEDLIRSLVIYIPHVDSVEDYPFYHPKVRGVAHYHEWDASTGAGFISIHFLPFADIPVAADKNLQRIAYHLLEVLHKHGEGVAKGYVKRVQHDMIVPQIKFQDRYAELKGKYARSLIGEWDEKTDPVKHVFEDLGIAAFLIEMWMTMYREHPFPGFVDIGCGNGLLVHILNQEGYSGWGFDARSRGSWQKYASPCSASPTGSSLAQRLLLPSIIQSTTSSPMDPATTHDGVFPTGTFIISNHADELTPWTPLLATLSSSPFLVIPCCSHALSGARQRHPPPKDKSKGSSTYASLVEWTRHIMERCGWEVETETLRIPSTRNIGLVGRRRTAEEVDILQIIAEFGGADGFASNVEQLLKGGPRGH
ncbi:uncharacterized protein J7T54_008519 [Emericellopsis cladophorae]|uniref:tRNA (uracil-O(2)-)-methyltransferase n=1 Tax=Emericellopsis cladophorae TaxID=2686198 RepID=A0A9P9XZM8_9HYPO|nr:uncharacterized protein J7T54_008519 [Emericellopsis cladophorae]KAI6780601.1 hypothetical protein J7T54_008519 [Emericellopsis cladophorae]